MSEARPTRLKFGPYITLKTIGASETSSVYTAMHETTGRMVALRVMTVTVKQVEQALSEAMTMLEELASVDLEHTVAIEDFGHDGNIIYIAMNVMNGGTLAQRIKARITDESLPQLPSPTEVLKMTQQIAKATKNLHEIGMVHGQIDPRSIMFNDSGEAFLADIGLTRIIKIIYRLDATNSFNMTRYSPPELWNGERPSPETDLYALACVVYQLLTGKPPFDGKSVFALMTAHNEDVAAPPHYVRKDLPEDLAMTFWQALAKPIDRRYPDVMMFYEDLENTFRGHSYPKTDFFTFLI